MKSCLGKPGPNVLTSLSSRNFPTPCHVGVPREGHENIGRSGWRTLDTQPPSHDARAPLAGTRLGPGIRGRQPMSASSRRSMSADQRLGAVVWLALVTDGREGGLSLYLALTVLDKEKDRRGCFQHSACPSPCPVSTHLTPTRRQRRVPCRATWMEAWPPETSSLPKNMCSESQTKGKRRIFQTANQNGGILSQYRM